MPSSGPRGEGGEGRVNSRYIFGFTEGADVERSGEREIENDTVMSFGKRSGDYTALQNKTEFEYGLTDDLLFAVGSLVSYHRIRGVTDLKNRDALHFNGLSTELKYRFFDRRTAPFGLGVAVEPEWTRFSGGGGRREDSYALETKVFIDKELIPDKIFAAVNFFYEPEAAHVREFDDNGRFISWERESAIGASGAINAAVAAGVFLGGEVRYVAEYSGLFFKRFSGDALFVGPTASVRIQPHALLQVAYSVQVTGESRDDPGHRLNLDGFERQQARLRFVYEF